MRLGFFQGVRGSLRFVVIVWCHWTLAFPIGLRDDHFVCFRTYSSCCSLPGGIYGFHSACNKNSMALAQRVCRRPRQ
ncbi:hypothetical protein Micbo1qcDRAFT_166760, partial [Microdochium bolleyi]